MKKRVAVVGATGIAGQQCLVALDGHPWFETHNTKMGAAKGAVLTAEYLVTAGYIR